jgi:hypothetical protein
MEHDLPIGLAPNIHVSLVMLPEEGRYLVDDPARYRSREFKLTVKKKLYRAKFLMAQKRLRAERFAEQAERYPAAVCS